MNRNRNAVDPTISNSSASDHIRNLASTNTSVSLYNDAHSSALNTLPPPTTCHTRFQFYLSISDVLVRVSLTRTRP
ncbi:hypothetical protein XELAEV_18039057mg [Xenopus laevis]|uniref:Uncharacterized protein n=1 Tax=Xenopus laevis TaxID=8355 RepID=A0A974C722_XENLA|nr:hypothetical protein XELAEV_18039057mg [Xenopus laevis]